MFGAEWFNFKGPLKIKGRFKQFLMSGVTCPNQGLLIGITHALLIWRDSPCKEKEENREQKENEKSRKVPCIEDCLEVRNNIGF